MYPYNYRKEYFPNHKDAQTYVKVYDDGTKELISYTTTVARIYPDGWLVVNGLYSATTRKHISWFMSAYTYFKYADAKRIYENKCRLNIYTGKEL